MSGKPLRITDFRLKKAKGEKIVMLTAYDATFARLLDRAGVDSILVGDSVGMVVQGHDTTLPVSLEEMVYHTRAVKRGTRRALVVADMPFLSFQVSVKEAIRNAGRLIQEGGAAAVKIEGGNRMSLKVIERLVEVGIPVMAHLGLTPQSVHQLGGFQAQARTTEEAAGLFEAAGRVEKAGAFSVVLESIPSELAARISSALSIPTIGIGAGPHCDGQVLVSYDALGLFDEFVPPFVKRFAHLGRQVGEAVEQYAREVRGGEFPAPEQTPYHLTELKKVK